MNLSLDHKDRAFEWDCAYVEGVTREREEPWRGYGIRYRPHGEHRLRVIFMDGSEDSPPSETMVLLAIAQHYDDDEAGRVRR